MALTALQLPTTWDDAPIDITALSLDKKRQAKGLRLPVVTAIGTSELRTISIESIIQFVSRRTP